MYEAGLVLEGGGMKGVYTCGVLDFFLDKELEFRSCYGVSAGACCLCSFLSKQKGRGYHVTVDYLEDKNYCGIYSLFTTGDLFGAEMCYHKIPEELYPYDYDTYNGYQGNFYSVVTNIETGRPEYIPIKDMKKDIDAIRASASLPLVSRNVKWKQGLYLDGGISDAIPLRRSIKDGNKKNIVIMTKETGYRRQPLSSTAIFKLWYRKYPKVYELMKNRHNTYNETLDYIDSQVKAGNTFLIQPKHKSNVGRIEKDRTKLEMLYREGYQDAAGCYESLLKFLEDDK
ncbi:MAG: patatin family protein [Lachnospiraceae bacterium]|jgi:predicted patatin/cPLA2 family phospholipase|uniref:patatin-like phospholipase family protein n=1 Tax=Parablautia intestinalis TaxID=2320100 RepID=UPI00256F2B90|nr:patatin family protein [Parablautia intestinalis]MCI8615760.1 patatin family protein [Lachnospiraceae bacterium]